MLKILTTFCFCLVASLLRAQRGSYRALVVAQETLKLPELPFSYDGLEPVIDAATLRVHHLGHHKAYCDKANVALQEWRAQNQSTDSLSRKSILEILQRLGEVPDKWRTRLRNNGGGFLNHVFYWETMCPTPEGEEPRGKLAQDIAKSFGSFADFKSEFSSFAAKLFGSGYVWLCESGQEPGTLTVVSTQNQDSPVSSGSFPLLVLDVWEHAYYLQHQNKRADYIAKWWHVVCWEHVSQLQQFWHQLHKELSSRQEL